LSICSLVLAVLLICLTTTFRLCHGLRCQSAHPSSFPVSGSQARIHCSGQRQSPHPISRRQSRSPMTFFCRRTGFFSILPGSMLRILLHAARRTVPHGGRLLRITLLLEESVLSPVYPLSLSHLLFSLEVGQAFGTPPSSSQSYVYIRATYRKNRCYRSTDMLLRLLVFRWSSLGASHFTGMQVDTQTASILSG
jgi:hypothetical protein